MTHTTHPLSDRQYCTDCNDPLGATSPRCYDCGGTPDRGDAVTAEMWQHQLGVPYPVIRDVHADSERTYAPDESGMGVASDD